MYLTLQLSSIYVAMTLIQALDLKPNYVRAWANMGISYANQVSSPLLIRALRLSSSVLYFWGLLYLNRKLLGACLTLLIFICCWWIWEYVYHISVSLYHIINIYTQHSTCQMPTILNLICFIFFQKFECLVNLFQLNLWCVELIHNANVMLSTQGMYEDSIRYYVRALAMNPKADNAWQYLRISLR